MTFEEYSKLAQRTDRRMPYQDARLHSIAGIMSEAGEVAAIWQKHLQGKQIDILERLEDELGDLLWFVEKLARVHEIPLERVARRNIEKLAERYGIEP